MSEAKYEPPSKAVIRVMIELAKADLTASDRTELGRERIRGAISALTWVLGENLSCELNRQAKLAEKPDHGSVLESSRA